ncbi:hypothetical protein Pve01_71880 [Planomonospora venezuelensis]|nr:hypothetical protein Pve01_71880 [Planomonospora venezuelensis]
MGGQVLQELGHLEDLARRRQRWRGGVRDGGGIRRRRAHRGFGRHATIRFTDCRYRVDLSK